jgi:serine/threonine protein kinase
LAAAAIFERQACVIRSTTCGLTVILPVVIFSSKFNVFQKAYLVCDTSNILATSSSTTTILSILSNSTQSDIAQEIQFFTNDRAETLSTTQIALISASIIVFVLSIVSITVLYLRRRRHLRLIKELGSGEFGAVCKASIRGRTVAAKKIFINLPNEVKFQVLRMFIQEAKIMMLMKHPRIVEFIDFDEAGMAIIMEYMPLGSLQSYILEKGSMAWTDRIQVIRDVTEGMAYLHAKEYNGEEKKDVFHQDLKSANVLLKKEGGMLRAKISDFGLSSMKEAANKSGSTTFAQWNGGSKYYQAPELFEDGGKVKFFKKSDVFAAGIVYLEIISLKPPQGLYKLLWPSILGKGLPVCLEQVLSGSLEMKQAERKTFEEIFSILESSNELLKVFYTNREDQATVEKCLAEMQME